MSAARPRVVPLSLAAAAALLLVAWGALLLGGSGAAALPAGTSRRIAAFAASLLGFPTELSPGGAAGAFRSTARWSELLALARTTLAMSVLAIGIAAASALVTVMPGAWPRAAPRSPVGRGLRGAAWALVRALWVGARAIPELVWAVLLVLVMPPGMLVGALALGVHNFGILGKLWSEVVENLDPAPARALRAGGAGPLQVLAYAVLPQALPQFLTFALYRWEVIIRTTIVVGFVGAGGLGLEFRLALSFFHYADVTMILATYFSLVVGVDLIASRLRALARD